MSTPTDDGVPMTAQETERAARAVGAIEEIRAAEIARTENFIKNRNS